MWVGTWGVGGGAPCHGRVDIFGGVLQIVPRQANTPAHRHASRVDVSRVEGVSTLGSPRSTSAYYARGVLPPSSRVPFQACGSARQEYDGKCFVGDYHGFVSNSP